MRLMLSRTAITWVTSDRLKEKSAHGTFASLFILSMLYIGSEYHGICIQCPRVLARSFANRTVIDSCLYLHELVSKLQSLKPSGF